MSKEAKILSPGLAILLPVFAFAAFGNQTKETEAKFKKYTDAEKAGKEKGWWRKKIDSAVFGYIKPDERIRTLPVRMPIKSLFASPKCSTKKGKVTKFSSLPNNKRVIILRSRRLGIGPVEYMIRFPKAA